MILGIGADLVDIRRIGRAIARFGDRFSGRIFTPDERSQASAHAEPAAFYARRFAAREACAKALGTGFRDGICWQDISVGNDALGKPRLLLSGGAQRRLRELAPAGYGGHVLLSLSDEPPYALAMVVISAGPAGAIPGEPQAPGGSQAPGEPRT